MSNGKVTLHEVFEVTSRVEEKLDKLADRVSVLEIWRAEIVGKCTVLVATISIGFSVAWDFVKSKFLK